MESNDRRYFRLTGFGLLCLLGSAFTVQAHESFMKCVDNQNGTVTCQGGYGDDSPPGSRDRILIKDGKNKTLIEGKFDKKGHFTFDKPGGNFSMVFAGAEVGHAKRVKSTDLK